MHRPDDLVAVGKFEGHPWREVEEWYLRSQAAFGGECAYELERRESEREMGLDPALKFLHRIRRVLAQQYHPDKGGSVEQMQEVNQNLDWLEHAAAFYIKCETEEGIEGEKP